MPFKIFVILLYACEVFPAFMYVYYLHARLVEVIRDSLELDLSLIMSQHLGPGK